MDPRSEYIGLFWGWSTRALSEAAADGAIHHHNYYLLFLLPPLPAPHGRVFHQIARDRSFNFGGGGNVCTHTCICCGGRSTPPPPDEIHIETVYIKKQTKYAYIISFRCFYIFKEHGRVINIFILGRNTTSIRHVWLPMQIPTPALLVDDRKW